MTDKLKSTLCKILERLDVINDWVVEYGTSGYWTYRKWNSGIAECWTQLNQDSASYPQGQEGQVFWRPSGNLYFPTGLFIAAPSAFVWTGNGESYLAWTSLRTLNDIYMNWYYVYDVNVSMSPYWQAYAKGAWKTLGGGSAAP